ncbi:capsular polysaccharide biosynthsis protein [Flavobacteriales bacterium ALC-1]|nr:capsular polysaccharide biosynthsis protein [Flavobacteriales bacterium ALC-1]
MKLSIIIPVYNVEKYISTCLDSIVNQDLKKDEYEVIIINDGSTDNSGKIVKTYSENYSNIFLYTQKNGGVGSARNKGLSYAKGDFVYFLDPDDYLAMNVLKTLTSTAVQYNLDVLTFDSTSFNDSSVLPENNSNNSEANLSDVITGIDYIAKTKYSSTVWLFLINRSFLIDIDLKFIKGRWMEDAIFTLELFIKVKRMAHLNINAYFYRVSSESAMNSYEPNHYLKLIDDNINAALVFNPIIQKLENDKVNPNCIKRVKARQQSFLFFSMIRMIKSTISFNEVKQIMNKMSEQNIFPLHMFLGKDYNLLSYHILTRVLNSKRRFYFFFLLFNPFLKLVYKYSPK